MTSSRDKLKESQARLRESQAKLKEAKKPKLDAEHREARDAMEHCPCYHTGGVCCGCGEEQSGCLWRDMPEGR